MNAFLPIPFPKLVALFAVATAAVSFHASAATINLVPVAGTTLQQAFPDIGNRTDALNTPVLTIEYSVVPEPGTHSLGALALLVCGFFRRRSQSV